MRTLDMVRLLARAALVAFPLLGSDNHDGAGATPPRHGR